MSTSAARRREEGTGARRSGRRWLRGLALAGALAPSLASAAEPAAPPEPHQPPRVAPADEAPRDASLVAFRTRLLEAAARRDRQALLELLDPGVLSSFGGEAGPAEFERFWKLDEPDSRVWSVLRDVVSRGGGFMEDGEFCAPYVYAKWPPDADPFEGALVAEDVPIHSAQDRASPVLARRSYEIVTLRGAEPEPTWYRVRTHDGIEGFVEASQLRSPADWRACFRKTAGGWRLTALVAGD